MFRLAAESVADGVGGPVVAVEFPPVGAVTAVLLVASEMTEVADD